MMNLKHIIKIIKIEKHYNDKLLKQLFSNVVVPDIANGDSNDVTLLSIVVPDTVLDEFQVVVLHNSDERLTYNKLSANIYICNNVP